MPHLFRHVTGGGIYGPGNGHEHAGKFDAIAGSSGPAGGAFFFGGRGTCVPVLLLPLAAMERRTKIG